MNEIIVFGGGCFWCTEAVFRELEGVVSVEPGYTGGATKNPTYEDVSSGNTGHVEVIQIQFDPRRVSVEDLLTVFFATHDPTTLNRQGNDVGTQYRSAIFYTTENQKKEALKTIQELGEGVVTEVAPLDMFYPAEEYHKDYFARNPEKAYCQAVIYPKVEKVQVKFKELLKKQHGI